MSAPKKPSRAELQPKDHEKHLSADLQLFEELPDNTQKQLLLSVEAEKATGKHRANFENKIKKAAAKAKH